MQEYFNYIFRNFFTWFTLFFVIASLLATYFLGIRPRGKQDRCSAKTKGTVIRPSHIRYNDMAFPVVEYYVDNIPYTVTGPKFQYVSSVTASTPFNDPHTAMETNLTTREDLPPTLKIRRNKNSMVAVTPSPVMDLFPVGTEVDVYYNPDKPKEAFVQRYVGYPKWLLWLLIAFNLVTIVFFLLEILIIPRLLNHIPFP